MVLVALHKPNDNVVGASRVKYSGESGSPSGKLRHDVDEGEGEAAHILLGRSGSQEGVELVL